MDRSNNEKDGGEGALPQGKRGRKNTRDKVEDRREQVWNLHGRGIKNPVIAKMFNVHVNMIKYDLKAIRRRVRQESVNVDAWEQVGLSIKFLDDMEKNAVFEYHAAGDNLMAKNRFLETAIRAREAKLRLQLNTGQIPKVADKVEEQMFIFRGLDIRKIGTEELTKRRDELRVKIFGTTNIDVNEILKKELPDRN